MDIELMKRLAPRVNVIPVIGKSDTLTPKELRDFKARVSDRQVHKLAFKFEIDFIRAH
jgi:cell division control protein 11